jgi:AcrR family transcriptional regulator
MIDAAVALLAEGGSPALTARAVAERAGVSVGTVYGSFDHLESLKLEANAVTMRALREALMQFVAPQPPSAGVGRVASGTGPEAQLLDLAHAYLGFAREHHRPWSALFDRTSVETPQALSAEIAALFAIVERVLARVDGLAPEQIPVVAKALWSSVHGMVYLGELGGLGPVDRDDVPAMIDTLVKAAVRGLPHR